MPSAGQPGDLDLDPTQDPAMESVLPSARQSQQGVPLGSRLAATTTLSLPQFSLALRRFLKSSHAHGSRKYTLVKSAYRSHRCCLCRCRIERGDGYVDGGDGGGGDYLRKVCMGCWAVLCEDGLVDVDEVRKT